MKEMKIKRLKLTPLAKQFKLCFGSKVNSARALRYKDKRTIYNLSSGEATKFHEKKMIAGFEAHEQDIKKLKEMLGLKT